jgi:hypothetical protein
MITMDRLGHVTQIDKSPEQDGRLLSVARYVNQTNTKTSRMDKWRSAEAVNGQMEKCRSCEWKATGQVDR